MMSNPKSDLPVSDHDDHSQPINLAAPRAPAPPISFSTNPGSTTSASTQPVTLRAHAETQKPGLMLQALYIRTPSGTARPPGPGHVMTPIMGNQVTSSQHFNTKPVFKGVKGVKVNYYSDKSSDKVGVTRMSPADNQLQSITTQSGPGPLVSSILPNALAGSSARHMVPGAVHPVISGSGSSPMASIIKGAHQVSQVGHVIHPPYSTHVPRGPAAVASITSAPKSAVATPILRAPHSSAMTLASSVISPHAAASFRARSPTLVTGRTATPPVVSSISHQQVIDLQKNPGSHSLQTQSQVCLASRSIDMSTSSIRQSISHVGSLNKPMNISQPIVQHLQQVRKHVSEKGYLKPVSSASITQSNSIPAHQHSSHLTSVHSTNADMHGVVPTITRATLSNLSGSGGYAAGIVQLSAGSVPALRPSLVQPHPVHALSSASSGSHQTLTVISAKSLQSASSPVTLSSQLNRTTTVGSANVISSGTVVTTTSGLPSTHSRLLNAPSSVNQSTAIPVAKVYPQSLPMQVKVDSMDLDSNRTGTLVTLGNTCSTASSVLTTTNTAPSQTMVVADKRTDSTAPVRVTSLGKHTVPNTAYASVPPATYLYDQYHGTTLAVHPYSMTSTNQNFANTQMSSSQLRPLALSQHGNANMGSGLHPSVCASGSSTGSVPPLNSLMVAVDSRHIALHPPYNTTSSSGKSNSEIASHQTTTAISSAAASLVVMSQASAAHGGAGLQGNNSNHLSPRPSILRKRATEGITGVTKRNLIPSLCATEPVSPRPEFKPAHGTLVSLKPASEALQENGVSTSASEPEGGRLLITGPVIRKELGNDEKSSMKESAIEASPRKKPRKQLLSANELMETHSSDAEENFAQQEVRVKEEKTAEENENVPTVFNKRPSMSLLSNYKHSWKSRHNHFLKYDDIKSKEEKKSTVHELANQKGVLQDVNAWKIYHLTGQMENLNTAEEACIARMSRWLDLEGKDSWMLNNNSSLSSEDYRILTKLTDIVKGNVQRSKIAQEQAMESQQQILKIVDHKPNLTEIVNKYISRRPLKKKEKT